MLRQAVATSTCAFSIVLLQLGTTSLSTGEKSPWSGQLYLQQISRLSVLAVFDFHLHVLTAN